MLLQIRCSYFGKEEVLKVRESSVVEESEYFRGLGEREGI